MVLAGLACRLAHSALESDQHTGGVLGTVGIVPDRPMVMIARMVVETAA